MIHNCLFYFESLYTGGEAAGGGESGARFQRRLHNRTIIQMVFENSREWNPLKRTRNNALKGPQDEALPSFKIRK